MHVSLRALNMEPQVVMSSSAHERGGFFFFFPDGQLVIPDRLASLTLFRFLGPHGRFTAYRDSEHGQRTRYWTASRCIHGREYRHYLGVTDHLTLARLEQIAAKLQSHVA